MKFDASTARARAAGLLDGFSRGQKAMLALVGVGLVAALLVFTRLSSSPNWAVLYGNLPPAEAAKVTEELTGMGVPYRLANGGASIEVPRSSVYQLRLDMSAKGLPSAGSTGYALLDKQGITTSEFRQRVDYQRALEGELAQTIGAIDGVDAAKVHLVIPSDDLFTDDTRIASASVLVGTPAARRLSAGQVQAIVHLVSSSVEGMSPESVTVADSSGRVLAAPGQAAEAGGDWRVEQERTFEDGLARSIEDMLFRVTGGGKAVVKVNADLDFDSRSKVTETFDKPDTATALTEKSSKESYKGAGAGAVGVLGPTGVPTAGATDGSDPAAPGAAQTPTAGAGTGSSAANAAANGANEYSRDDVERQFAIGKVTEKVDTSPGSIRRLSVAVLLDRRSKPDQARLTALVAAAAGLDEDRGDVLEVGVLNFDTADAKAAEEELAAVASAQRAAQQSSMIRTAIVGLVVLVSLLLAWRAARKSALTVQRIPIDVEPYLELEPVRDDDAGAAVPAPLDAAELERRARADKVSSLIDETPEDVAKTLRAWMADRRAS
jgi:flagellar M-ring protein FliF